MNEQLITGLKALLAFIRNNDDFDFEAGACGRPQVEMNFYQYPLKGDQKGIILELARRMGSLTKHHDSHYFRLNKSFGEFVEFRVAGDRDLICERVVTGIRVVPAQEARFIPAIAQHTEDVVEWRCTSLLMESEK